MDSYCLSFSYCLSSFFHVSPTLQEIFSKIIREALRICLPANAGTCSVVFMNQVNIDAH